MIHPVSSLGTERNVTTTLGNILPTNVMAVLWALRIRNIVQYTCQQLHILLVDDEYDIVDVVILYTTSLDDVISRRYTWDPFFKYMCDF